MQLVSLELLPLTEAVIMNMHSEVAAAGACIQKTIISLFFLFPDACSFIHWSFSSVRLQSLFLVFCFLFNQSNCTLSL